MHDSRFHFKQFVIQQDKCAMKVGTDAVLLGSWINPQNAKKILDIGTGTGVIAIMLAQKTNAIIDAIDIDEMAYQQAKENIGICPWKDIINVFHSSVQDFYHIGSKEYDLIVSNPPYFVDASKPSLEARTLARHTDDSLSYDELIEGVLSLLGMNGRFCLILPFKEGFLFKEKAYKKGLFCTQLTKVKTKVDKQEKRLMMQFEREENSLTVNELIIQEEDLSYTKEYIEFTKDYYIGLKTFRHEKK